jgi:type IV pilus assembly protein PilO
MAGLDVITGISTPKKVIVGVVLAGAIAAVYYFVFYRAAVQELADAQDALSSVRAQNDQAKRDYQKYQQLTADLVAARQAAEQLNKQLPTSRDLEDFMSRLNTQAKAAGLRITNIVPLQEESAEYYTKLPIKLEFRGTYHQVFRFFALVDREIERPVNMENLTLTRDRRSEAEPNMLQGVVRATTFMAKESRAQAPAARGRRRGR